MSDPNTPESAAPQPPASTPPPAAPQYGSAATPPPAALPQYAAPPQYAAAPAGPYSAETDRQLAMWAHIGGIVGFLPALIIWLIGKDRGPRTNVEGKEALNWQITFTIGYIALWIVTSVLTTIFWVLGLFLWVLPLAWWILNIVWSIQGGIAVNAGRSYRYPWSLRLIK